MGKEEDRSVGGVEKLGIYLQTVHLEEKEKAGRREEKEKDSKERAGPAGDSDTVKRTAPKERAKEKEEEDSKRADTKGTLEDGKEPEKDMERLGKADTGR